MKGQGAFLKLVYVTFMNFWQQQNKHVITDVECRVGAVNRISDKPRRQALSLCVDNSKRTDLFVDVFLFAKKFFPKPVS